MASVLSGYSLRIPHLIPYILDFTLPGDNVQNQSRYYAYSVKQRLCTYLPPEWNQMCLEVIFNPQMDWIAAHIKIVLEPDVVAHAFNPSRNRWICEIKASWETLSQQQQKQNW